MTDLATPIIYDTAPPFVEGDNRTLIRVEQGDTDERQLRSIPCNGCGRVAGLTPVEGYDLFFASRQSIDSWCITCLTAGPAYDRDRGNGEIVTVGRTVLADIRAGRARYGHHDHHEDEPMDVDAGPRDIPLCTSCGSDTFRVTWNETRYVVAYTDGNEDGDHTVWYDSGNSDYDSSDNYELECADCGAEQSRAWSIEAA